MKRGLTLIELIFSMVIIAIAFTIFPKILQISAKSAKTSLKEEAMYNAAALIGLIKALPWDEQNSEYDDILLTSAGESDYECSYDLGGENIYRKGGFIGSRQCPNTIEASPIGDDGDSEPDDIDDFDGKVIEAQSESGYRDFNISIEVSYVKDPRSDSSVTEMNNSINDVSTNTKYISLTVKPNKKANILGTSFGRFWYVSYNIGQLKINKAEWEQ